MIDWALTHEVLTAHGLDIVKDDNGVPINYTLPVLGPSEVPPYRCDLVRDLLSIGWERYNGDDELFVTFFGGLATYIFVRSLTKDSPHVWQVIVDV